MLRPGQHYTLRKNSSAAAEDAGYARGLTPAQDAGCAGVDTRPGQVYGSVSGLPACSEISQQPLDFTKIFLKYTG
jgi:hypothetical protein